MFWLAVLIYKMAYVTCVSAGIVKLTNKLRQASFSQGDLESLEVNLFSVLYLFLPPHSDFFIRTHSFHLVLS